MRIFDIDFKPHSSRSGWFVGQFEGDSQELEAIAQEMNDHRLAPDYFAVCGFLPDDEQHRLFLIPDKDPVQIARDFEVGSHGEEHEPAIRELVLVHEKNPIVPFFADAAGFKFKFRNDITDEFVKFLEATLSAGVDEQLLNEDGELNVKETGVVHLWWD